MVDSIISLAYLLSIAHLKFFYAIDLICHFCHLLICHCKQMDIQCTCVLVEVHLCCFQFRYIMNKAALIFLYGFWCKLGEISRSGVTESYGKDIFNVIRKPPKYFPHHTICNIFHIYQQCMSVPLLYMFSLTLSITFCSLVQIYTYMRCSF